MSKKTKKFIKSTKNNKLNKSKQYKKSRKGGFVEILKKLRSKTFDNKKLKNYSNDMQSFYKVSDQISKQERNDTLGMQFREKAGIQKKYQPEMEYY